MKWTLDKQLFTGLAIIIFLFNLTLLSFILTQYNSFNMFNSLWQARCVFSSSGSKKRLSSTSSTMSTTVLTPDEERDKKKVGTIIFISPSWSKLVDEVMSDWRGWREGGRERENRSKIEGHSGGKRLRWGFSRPGIGHCLVEIIVEYWGRTLNVALVFGIDSIDLFNSLNALMSHRDT